MDIAALSMAMAQNKIMESFGVEMLSKTLDTQEQIGNEVVQMIDSAAMERSINPAIGGNIDIIVQHNQRMETSAIILPILSRQYRPSDST